MTNITKILTTTGFVLAAAPALAAMSDYDVNQDGSVDLNEYRQVFEQNDGSYDYTPVREARDYSDVEDVGRASFNYYDKDDDGLLGYDEFGTFEETTVGQQRESR